MVLTVEADQKHPNEMEFRQKANRTPLQASLLVSKCFELALLRLHPSTCPGDGHPILNSPHMCMLLETCHPGPDSGPLYLAHYTGK